MPVSILAWLVSIAVHGVLTLALFMPGADGAAFEEGPGDDIMVVEQGIAIEGIAKLGEDTMTVDAVEAPPMMSSVAQPLEQVEAVQQPQERPVQDVQQVQPVQDMVIASETGPESELVQPMHEVLQEPQPDMMQQADVEPIQELVDEPELTEQEIIEPVLEPVEEPVVREQEIVEQVQEPVNEPEQELKQQPLPQQIASVQQQTVIALRASSGRELKGGDVTAHREYLGRLRTHLEGTKVNPRTARVGTTVIRLTVRANGQLVSHQIVESSGSKVLDNAAVASIERAAPFPLIPSEVGEETVSVVVPFRFTVR